MSMRTRIGMLEGNIQPNSPERQHTMGQSDDAERQKKTRNLLKKLKKIRELKDKKTAGEKLSPDQVMKIGRENELLRDLEKLGHNGSEMTELDLEIETPAISEAG